MKAGHENMHKLLRKRILVFVVVIGVVSLVNIIKQLVLTDLYTIAYPENLSDMQKNIDSNLIAISKWLKIKPFYFKFL